MCWLLLTTAVGQGDVVAGGTSVVSGLRKNHLNGLGQGWVGGGVGLLRLAGGLIGWLWECCLLTCLVLIGGISQTGLIPAANRTAMLTSDVLVASPPVRS